MPLVQFVDFRNSIVFLQHLGKTYKIALKEILGSMAAEWLVLLDLDWRLSWGKAFLCNACMFHPCLRGFSPGTPANSHILETYKS